MDIVREKEFIELTAEDRAELGELCSSEDEYNQIKSMFVGMSSMDWSNPTPKAETKASLDALFAETYPKAAPVWYNAPLAVLIPKEKPIYRQPLVQVAAIGLLVLLAYPFVNSTALEANSEQVATLEKEMTAPAEDDAKSAEETNKNTEDSVAAEEKEGGVSFQLKKESDATEEGATRMVTPQPEKAVRASANSSVTESFTTISAPTSVKAPTFSDSELSNGTFAWTELGSTHPDGVFVEEKVQVFSTPASHEPAVFDLLTSTF